MIEELLGNLNDMSEQMQKNLEVNKSMKDKAMATLSEDEKNRIEKIEAVAKKFSDSGDLSGLMNYMNSVQEKMKKDASND